MPLPTLTLQTARLMNLEAQGLLTPPPAPAVKGDVLAVIRRMGVLQIDTIHVVARSPYFVLFSRLGGYQPAWLDELLAEGAIFEHWAHAASFLPVEDYAYSRRFMLDGLRDYFHHGWKEENSPVVEAVLEAVRANGPMRSADFESDKGPGGWWNWKIEKAALEYWFSRGDLMVARREKFQRVYDLRERVLPGWDDAVVPPLEEVYRELVLKSVNALGLARPSWVADYYRLPKRRVPGLLKELVGEGRLVEVPVEGWGDAALIVPERMPLLEAAARGELRAGWTTLLSPFDPLTWDRERARQLFDFDFTIECYTPAPKRVYGYFPLPILHNGALVGRLDAKAHRKEGIFEVKALYLEAEVSPTPELAEALAGAIQRCATWHGASQVSLGNCVPPEFKPMLASWFS
jgi:uncharacterized protein YcaQ